MHETILRPAPKPYFSGMNRIPNLLIRQVLLLLLIFGLGWALFSGLLPFLPAFLGAYTLYVLLRQPMFFLAHRWQWHKVLAAVVLMLLMLTVIWVPLQFLVQLMQGRLIETVQHSPAWLHNLEVAVHQLENKYGVTVLTPEMLKNLNDWSLTQARSLITATIEGVTTALLAGFILFFMLIQGRQMETQFLNWVPLRPENAADLKRQLNNLVFSNAVGIPLLGLLQGLAALPAYWIAGVDNFMLWVALTAITGMLPVLGVALAYVPLSLLLIADGMLIKGIVLFLYGFIVIGSADNVGRMWLQKKLGNTHPLITLFGVILGLKLFGFIGFVFGPILISLFLLLIRIYSKEFGHEGHAAH